MTSFPTLLTREVINGIQRGTMAFTYRGIPTLKCPFDIALYSKILWELRPAAIIEIGSKHGGSALWFADTLISFGLGKTEIYSYDIEPVKDCCDPRITFGYIDVRDPCTYPPAAFMAALPKPLLVIEDSTHDAGDVLAILRFFHRWTALGDYLIIEDGIIHYMPGVARYRGGPLRAIQEFLLQYPAYYEIDRTKCDFFGQNVTWNIDGYLRRIRA
jgi:cephalosporin hydroxylase